MTEQLYQVDADGQRITRPLPFSEARYLAVEENKDTKARGDVPICKVVPAE